MGGVSGATWCTPHENKKNTVVSLSKALEIKYFSIAG